MDLSLSSLWFSQNARIHGVSGIAAVSPSGLHYSLNAEAGAHTDIDFTELTFFSSSCSNSSNSIPLGIYRIHKITFGRHHGDFSETIIKEFFSVDWLPGNLHTEHYLTAAFVAYIIFTDFPP